MDDAIVNQTPFANAHVMAFQHLQWIMNDGLDGVSNAALYINFTGATDAMVASHTKLFLGAGLLDAVLALADHSFNKFRDLMVENGVLGYAIIATARHYKLAVPDHLDRCGMVQNHCAEFVYERELKELVDGDINQAAIDSMRALTIELMALTGIARAENDSRPPPDKMN